LQHNDNLTGLVKLLACQKKQYSDSFLSWTSNLRKPGRPQILPRTTYAQATREIISTISTPALDQKTDNAFGY
jgi:hypothetical protein